MGTTALERTLSEKVELDRSNLFQITHTPPSAISVSIFKDVIIKTVSAQGEKIKRQYHAQILVPYGIMYSQKFVIIFHPT